MTNETDRDLLLIAEKLGSALDRIEKIETDFAVQAAPIQAAGSAQDAALKSLEAALFGIKALNQHVLQNDLGLLSAKVEEGGKQFEKAIVAIDAKVAANIDALAVKLGTVRAELAAATATRIELSAAREDAATKVKSLAVEFTQELASVRSELAARVAEFSEPKGMEPAGEWESGKMFDRLSIVTLNGSSFISKIVANNEKPSERSKAWQMLARRGGGGGVSSFDALSGVILPQQLVPGAVTYAVGDVLYAGTTGALAKLAPGTSGQLLSTQGASAAPIWVTATGGAGDVNGPASATDNAIARYDGTGGKTIQNSAVTISDTGVLATVGTSSGVTIAGTTISTNSTSGALQVVGGVGVGGTINIGGLGQSNFAGAIVQTGSLLANQTSATAFGFSSARSNFYSFGANAATAGQFYFNTLSSDASINVIPLFITSTGISTSVSLVNTSPTAGLGYGTGAGGAVTQITSRTTGVTLSKVSGAITLFAAAGSATAASFTVTNTAVAATDVVQVSVKSGTNKYLVHVTATAAGSFEITFQTTGGTASTSGNVGTQAPP